MIVKFLSGGNIHRWSVVLALATAVGLVGVAAACSGGAATPNTGATPTTAAVTTTAASVTAAEVVTTTQAVTTTPTNTPSTAASTEAVRTTPLSKTEIAKWKADAIAFADRFAAAGANVDQQFADFAEDATNYDPSDGAFFDGRAAIIDMQRDFLQYMPGFKAQRKGLYLSGDGAAYVNAEENMWPPWVPEPANHPPVDELDVFRFKDGLATSWDVWFSGPTLEMVSFGSFASGKGGPEQLQKIADQYLSAWSSGDVAQIAALYSDNASFSDTMLGLHARGAAAISELLDRRFGPGGKVTFKILDLYAQTDGPYPPDSMSSRKGAIIAVGIHYRGTLAANGTSKTIEGLTTLQLGTRQGKYFSLDPNGLITQEEVFYDPDSLLASGLAP